MPRSSSPGVSFSAPLRKNLASAGKNEPGAAPPAESGKLEFVRILDYHESLYMRKSRYRFLILGAGVSGLASAVRLSERFPGEVLVIEKEAQVGGLLRTVERNGARYDLGSHRIHKDPSQRAFRLIQEVCGNKVVRKERGGQLRLKKTYLDYPITSFQMFRGIGLFESGLCAASLLKNRLLSGLKKDAASVGQDNYESYLIRRAGRRAYRLFYEPYARKVWGGEPSMISTTAVKKRVSMTSPTLFLKDMVAHYTRRSKDSYYYYIQGGMSGLAEALARQVRERGGKIMTGVRDFSLNLTSQGRAIRLAAGETPESEFETLVSTIPIEELLAKLAPPENILRQAAKVGWRGLRLVFVHVEGEPRLKGESFYYPELKYIFGRVSVPKRFDPAMQPDSGQTALTCEVPCSQNDKLWNTPEEEMYELCLESLRRASLIGRNQGSRSEKNFIISLPKIYPLYRVGWDEVIKGLLLYSAEQHPFAFFSGKPGLFLHNNIDHSIEIGLSLADDIIAGASPLDWIARLNVFHSLKLRD
jgi:protoporphyrinogen oxidase